MVFGSVLFLRNLKTKAMAFVMNDVHIGQMIQAELNRQGRTVVWFAKTICCEKSNVYKLFKRKSIDLDQLMKISQALNYNFLKDCYEEL
jgi:predicted transcriptional regulator